MSCDWVQTNWNWGYGGDDGITVSLFLSFSPSPYMIAQTTLSNAVSQGLLFAGITEYTVRPVPNGPDQPVTFTWNDNFGFPASVWDNNMSSVTAEMNIGGGDGQYGSYNLTVYYLS